MRDSLVEITEWSNGGLAARLFRCRVDNVDFDYPGALTFRPLALDPATLPPLDTVANVGREGRNRASQPREPSAHSCARPAVAGACASGHRGHRAWHP